MASSHTDDQALLDALLTGPLGQRLYDLARPQSPACMSFVTLDRRLIRCNEAMCRLIGYTHDELVSIDIGKLTYPDDTCLHEEDHRQLLAGTIDHYQLVKRYIHKDGHVFPARLRVEVLRDLDGRPHFLVSQTEALREREPDL